MRRTLKKLLAVLALAGLLAGCAVGPITHNGTPYPPLYTPGSD